MPSAVENDVLAWVELILAAILDRQDASPLVALAMRAGVDLDMLQLLANTTLDSLRDHMMVAAGLVGMLALPQYDIEQPSFTADDVAELKQLGIAAAP